MKYKKKEKRENGSDARRTCITTADYAKYSKLAATIEATKIANNLITKTTVSGGCTWQGAPELQYVSYTIDGGLTRGYGPEPDFRCQDDRDVLDAPSFSILGCGKPPKTVLEYIPGGSRPPCNGGVEGSCSETSKSREFTQGSQWEPDGPGNPVDVFLNFEYRTVFSNGSGGGSTKCNNPPSPTNWQRYSQKVGQAQTEEEQRCVTDIKNYDCCCDCSQNPVKVAEIIPGLSPCYNLQLNQAQAEQLKTAINAALIAGACVLAAVLAAKLSALVIGAALAARCAYAMVTLTAACQK